GRVFWLIGRTPSLIPRCGAALPTQVQGCARTAWKSRYIGRPRGRLAPCPGTFMLDAAEWKGEAGAQFALQGKAPRMDDIALARVLHVLAIVIWIGGVSMATTIALPAVRRGDL